MSPIPYLVLREPLTEERIHKLVLALTIGCNNKRKRFYPTEQNSAITGSRY